MFSISSSIKLRSPCILSIPRLLSFLSFAIFLLSYSLYNDVSYLDLEVIYTSAVLCQLFTFLYFLSLDFSNLTFLADLALGLFNCFDSWMMYVKQVLVSRNDANLFFCLPMSIPFHTIKQ